MRKLATIRVISEIAPIPGADNIEVATVDGWKVVVKKGEFTPGQRGLYCEIDSLIPHDLAPFLSRGQDKDYYRLKTVKLRGQMSQGLLLPIPEMLINFDDDEDCSELLGIKKWEDYIPTCLGGVAKGSFPSFIPKTDQERCQNLVRKINEKQGEPFEVTEKLDGSSMTCYLKDGEFGVCSRNLNIKESEDNSYWATANRLNIKEKLLDYGHCIALQGELVGPKIQGNKYKLESLAYYIFDIFDIKQGAYLNPTLRRHITKVFELDHVPVISKNYELSGGPRDLLKMADGQSCLNTTDREGLVFKSCDGGFSFKAISDKFLLKND